MAGKFVTPYLDSKNVAFTCPNCESLAQQGQTPLAYFESVKKEIGVVIKQVTSDNVLLGNSKPNRLWATICHVCSHQLLWAVPIETVEVGNRKTKDGIARAQLTGSNQVPQFQKAFIIYPEVNALPPCNADAPTKAINIYREASNVFGRSNRACAALIRVATEALLRHHFNSKKMLASIIDDHKKELGELYSTAEALRLIGNDGSHPDAKTIDLDEDVDDIVEGLFMLFNATVEKLISIPKRQKEMMEKIENESKKHKAMMDKIARKSKGGIPSHTEGDDASNNPDEG